MRELTNRQLKAVEKLGKKFDFFALTQSHGGLSAREGEMSKLEWLLCLATIGCFSLVLGMIRDCVR